MMERIAEASPRFKSRMAGFLYLLIIVGALFAPFAVAPSGMMRGDAGDLLWAAQASQQGARPSRGILQARFRGHSKCQRAQPFCAFASSEWRSVPKRVQA